MEAASTHKANHGPNASAIKMAEIRESQRRLQEDLAEAKGKLADIHADTQAKLAEAKKNIKAVKEKEWHQ